MTYYYDDDYYNDADDDDSIEYDDFGVIVAVKRCCDTYMQSVQCDDNYDKN